MVPPGGLQDDLQRDLGDDSQPMKKLYTNIQTFYQVLIHS